MLRRKVNDVFQVKEQMVQFISDENESLFIKKNEAIGAEKGMQRKRREVGEIDKIFHKIRK